MANISGRIAGVGQIKGGISRGGGGAKSYTDLTDLPIINGVVILGDKVGADYSLQDLLIAGSGITIEDNGDHTATITALAGGGGLTADLTVSNPIGRYKMDDVIDEGTSFDTIFRGLLSKTYYPTLTDPTASVTFNVPTLVKVGETIPATKATVNFNRGSINPQYTAASPYRAGEAGRYQVSLSGASDQWTDSNASGQFDVPAFTRNISGNVNLMAWAYYYEGVQPKDSDGNDYESPLPSGYVRANKAIEFIFPFYWGKKAAASLTDLSGLTEDLSKKGQKTYTYSGANNEYLYIVYSAGYGNLKSILDENNFENIDSWIKSTLTVDGNTYNVYRSGFAITGSPPFTFKF